MKRTDRVNSIIREAWSANRMNLVRRGIPLDSIPADERGLVQTGRRAMMAWWAHRASKRNSGPLFKR